MTTKPVEAHAYLLFNSSLMQQFSFNPQRLTNFWTLEVQKHLQPLHVLPLTQYFYWWCFVSFISQGKHLYVNLHFFGLFWSCLHPQSVVKNLQGRSGSSEIIIKYILSWYFHHVLLYLVQGMNFQLWSINNVKRQASCKTNTTFHKEYLIWLEEVIYIDLFGLSVFDMCLYCMSLMLL